jgi:hypothetical protein
MNGAVTGIILVTCNDMPLLPNMWSSFEESMVGIPHGLICVDAGSTDGSVEFMRERCWVLGPQDFERTKPFASEHTVRKPEDFKDLSRCLNLGIDVMRKQKGVHHISHIHPDMDFMNGGKGTGWIRFLENYLKEHPDVAKVAPQIDPSPSYEERPGNQCPWVLRREAIEKLLETDGYVFDVRFLRCWGAEDWDLHKRLLNLKYKIMIAPGSSPIVGHEGMGTRGRERDGAGGQAANMELYCSKWKTSGPPV